MVTEHGRSLRGVTCWDRDDAVFSLSLSFKPWCVSEGTLTNLIYSLARPMIPGSIRTENGTPRVVP